MKTIFTENGHIPEHRVIRFYTTEETTKAGTNYTQHWIEYEGAERPTRSRCSKYAHEAEPPMIPAAPGFSLLDYNPVSDCAESVPVVAWRLRSDRVVPVPLGSLADARRLEFNHLCYYAVLAPDGAVYATEPYTPGPDEEGDDWIPSYSLGDPITTRLESIEEWLHWERARRHELDERTAKHFGEKAA